MNNNVIILMDRNSSLYPDIVSSQIPYQIIETPNRNIPTAKHIFDFTTLNQQQNNMNMNKLSYVEVLLLGMAVVSFTLTVFVLGSTFL